MDKNSIISVLTELYDSSKVPTVLTDGVIISENADFKKMFPHMSTLDKNNFLSDLGTKDGINYKMLDGKVYTVNIISHFGIKVVEIIHSEPIEKLLAIPAVQEFMKYAFARLRQSVTVISVAADEIYNVFSSNLNCTACVNSDNVVESLNSIDSSLLDIISAIIDPEQLFYLLDDNSTDVTISVQDELKKITAEMSDDISEYTIINTQLDDAIYVRMNRLVFHVIIMDMVSKCCYNKYIPDELIISAKRENDGCAVVTVSSDASSRRKFSSKDPLSTPVGNNSSDFKRDMFFEYICDMFCSRYNGSFTMKENDTQMSYSLKFPIIKPAQINLASSAGFNVSGNHFGVISVRLRAMRKAKRYDKINIRSNIKLTAKEQENKQ